LLVLSAVGWVDKPSIRSRPSWVSAKLQPSLHKLIPMNVQGSCQYFTAKRLRPFNGHAYVSAVGWVGKPSISMPPMLVFR